MGKREVIKGKPKSWATRGKDGKFQNWTSRKRAAKADRRTQAKTTVKSGYGHQGDLKKRTKHRRVVITQNDNPILDNWLGFKLF